MVNNPLSNNVDCTLDKSCNFLRLKEKFKLSAVQNMKMNNTLRIIIFLLYLPLAVNYSWGISRDPSRESLYVKYVGRMRVKSALALLFWITDQEILFLFTLQLLMDKCPEIITNFLLSTSHGRWENIQMIKSTVSTCFDFTDVI